MNTRSAMRRSVVPALVLGVAACAGGPVSTEQRQAAEQRLLAPFLRATEVGCSELLVELTPNFYPVVSQPAVDVQAHRASKQRGADYTETTWTNTLGRPQSAFVVTIGEAPVYTDRGPVLGPRTRFTVLQRVTFRVYEGPHAMQLDARATGVVVVRDGVAARPRDVREYAVVQGAVQAP